MSLLIRNTLLSSLVKLPARAFGSSSTLNTKQWRVEKGLPKNRNAEGFLTDGPDYTFLDGRPTPLLHKQILRIRKQQNFAAQIVELTEELEFAQNREKRMLEAKEQERRKILGDRLKPKGVKLFRK